MKKLSGIYCIENLKNGKKYIGQSADIKCREKTHFTKLRGNYHPSSHLQNAFNKYGENSFKFTILVLCEIKELTKREQYFIDTSDKTKLYNVRLECVDSNLGMKHTEETRKKMSQNHGDISGKNNPNYGKHLSEETREKISKANGGRHLSKETRKKLSEANSGKNHPMYGKHRSKETKRKMSEAKHGKNNPMYGKHLSEETKKKMSEAHCGKNNPMYGKHFSEETKRKMSKNHFDVSGIKSPNSKFTKYEIFDILNLYYNENKKITEIAKKYYFVSKPTIHKICHGERYKPCYNHFIKNKGAI